MTADSGRWFCPTHRELMRLPEALASFRFKSEWWASLPRPLPSKGSALLDCATLCFAPKSGLEPLTPTLTASCSAIELLGIKLSELDLHQHLFSPREGFAVKLPENNIILNIIFKCINVKYKIQINSRLDLHQHLPVQSGALTT